MSWAKQHPEGQASTLQARPRAVCRRGVDRLKCNFLLCIASASRATQQYAEGRLALQPAMGRHLGLALTDDQRPSPAIVSRLAAPPASTCCVTPIFTGSAGRTLAARRLSRNRVVGARALAAQDNLLGRRPLRETPTSGGTCFGRHPPREAPALGRGLAQPERHRGCQLIHGFHIGRRSVRVTPTVNGSKASREGRARKADKAPHN